MKRYGLYTCGVLLVATAAWTSPAGEAGPSEVEPVGESAGAEILGEEDFAQFVATIEGPGDLEQKKEAARRLGRAGDPRVLPHVAHLLDEDHETDIRRILSIGVARSLSDEAPDFFLELARNGSANQQEAALSVMGTFNDPRIMEVLEKYLMSDDERLRRAARFGTSTRGRAAVMATTMRLHVEDAEPVPPRTVGRLDEVRRAMRRLVAADEALSPEARDLVWSFADYDLTRVAQKHYLRSVRTRRLRSVLSKFFRANRHWLGRPPAPEIDRLDYTLHLQLVGREEPVSLPFWVDADDIDRLRVESYHVDRGGRLSFPLDFLMVMPDLAKPTLLEDGDTGVQLRYQVSDLSRLVVGLGTLDLAYWEGKILEPSHAIVTIDLERNVPVSEAVYTEDGLLGANLKYENYQRLDDGSWVPLRIEVDAPEMHVAARTGHMRYVLRYQLLDGNTWLLADANATEVTHNQSQLRAYQSLRDPVVHR